MATQIFICLIILPILEFFTYLIYKKTQIPTVVDVTWGLGFIFVSTYLLIGKLDILKIALVFSLVLIWGIRLSAYLYFTRVKQKTVDIRYQNLSNEWTYNKDLGFFINFQIQGLLIGLMCMPFYILSSIPAAQILTTKDVLCVIIIVVGIIGESMADFQLYQFKSSNKDKSQAQQKKVLDTKLWSISRHPNYFFEWVIWFGFCGLTFGGGLQLLSIIPILILTTIFYKFSGPRTENASIQSKGELYIQYQKKVPFLFPKFW